MTVSEDFFDKILVLQPTHDFSPLRKYSDRIEFLTTGYESSWAQVKSSLEKNLNGFDPDTDAIVAVGKVNSAVILGMVLQSRFPDKPIRFGQYVSDEEAPYYHWIVSPLSYSEI